MKKKTYVWAIVAILTILCVACSRNPDKDMTSVQRIMGAGDCIKCEGWSWSNGEATTTNTSSDLEMHSFSFKVTVTGELSFYHKMESYYTVPELDVSIDDKTYFHVRYGSYSYDAKQSSIGDVKAGDTVTFSGVFYTVKDIQIVGEAGSSNQSGTEDSSGHQWDF